MNIHEYQAKELLAKFGVAVPRGGVAYSANEAVEVARRLGGEVWVVKAQIHAGGRGKASGVKLAGSEAGDPSDGTGGPRGQTCLCRGGLRHRPRALSRDVDRPHHPTSDPDRLNRGR